MADSLRCTSSLKLACRVFLRSSPGPRTAANRAPEAKKKVNKKWVTTGMNIKGMNHTLTASLGFGLEVYMPLARITIHDIAAAETCELRLEKLLSPRRAASRPVLSLCLDEESSGWSAAKLLQARGLRVEPKRDPCHRKWNQRKRAIDRAGLTPTAAKSLISPTINHEPWLLGGFFGRRARRWR